MGRLFVCIVVCRLCLEKRGEDRRAERGRERFWRRTGGLPFIFSAWIQQKVITHNNRISALFAWHIFPSGLWSVPPSVRSLKKCPRQTALSTTVKNMSCPLSQYVLRTHNCHFFSCLPFLRNNWVRSPTSGTHLCHEHAGAVISNYRVLGLTSYPVNFRMWKHENPVWEVRNWEQVGPCYSVELINAVYHCGAEWH